MEERMGMTKNAGKYLAFLRKAMTSEIWMAAETLLAALFFLLGQEVIGVVVFVYLISLKLIVSDDSLCPFLDFLLIGLMVLRLYDSFDKFMSLKFVMGVPAVVGLLFHFTVYRKMPQKGALTVGYLFLSFALALGGLFSIPVAHYFSGTALYYTYGLGFGMLLLYSVLLKRVNPRGEYDIREYVAKTAFYCALFAVFIIAVQYLGHIAEIKADGWQFSEKNLSSISNNLSTTVLLTMPFLFYLSRKGGARGAVSFAVGILEGLAAVLSLSRGGIIFASGMCAFLVVYTLIKDKAGRTRDLIVLLLILAVCGLVFGIFHKQFEKLYHEGIISLSVKIKVIFFAAVIVTAAATTYVYYLFRLKSKEKRNVHLAAISALVITGIVVFAACFDEIKPLLVEADYYRGNMMIIAARNFKTYPIFGTGIGYRGLRHIYENKQGMFGCYHCLPVQIVGSMGLFGVAAYLYMFRERMRALKNAQDKPFAVTVLFSYLGLLWISLVNPGIFCPVVYGLQLAVYFIAAEKAGDTLKNPEK